MRKPHTEEYKKKMSERLKGRKFSDEHKKNLSISKSGKNHHFYGKKQSQEHIEKRVKHIRGNKWLLGYKHTDEAKKNMGLSKIGHTVSEETKRKIGLKSKGRKHTDETRKKMSIAKIGKTGEKSNAWGHGDGRTSTNLKIRTSKEYRLWRTAVFERDNYTCIWCSKRGGKINADHIKSFSQFPELRFAIDNGRTLCEPCHRTTDNFGWKAVKKLQPNVQS